MHFEPEITEPPAPATRTAPGALARAIRLLWRSARPERRHLHAGVVWLMLAAALDVLGPLFGKALIDGYLLPHRLDWPRMSVLLGAALLAGWLASALRYLQLVRLSGLAMRSVQRLRQQLYEHVLRLPMAFFDRAITGQLVSRVTNDTDAVKTLYIQVLFVFLDNGIILVGAIFAMAWLDWHLMLIVLLLVPAVVAIVWLYQRQSAPAVARSRELRSDINAHVAESIGGMPLLQATNATPRFRRRFSQINGAHYAARQAEVRANAWLLRPALDMLHILLLVVVIYSFGQRRLSGLEVGILYAFVSYVARVVDPLIQITLQFSGLQQAVIATTRVDQLLSETRPSAGVGTARMDAGAVTLRQVDFSYERGHPVLQDVNLAIPAGAFYGIVGHTGSGKTTLLNLLLRFYRADTGSICIDGQSIDAFDDQALRAAIGLVPQEPHLLAASVRDNIDMGRGLEQGAIEAAARAAHVHDFIIGLDAGYATLLDEGGSMLSTGQKQLLAIARALAGQPRILFLDEATARVDSATEQVVQQALHALRGRVTIIAVAHRLSTIRDADAIVVLHHGRIAEQGTHAALMTIDAGIYQRLYLVSCASEVAEQT
jgi:ATP-binding cassette subfamily B multidrug efflux pump